MLGESKLPQSRSLAERIGGRWLLSWQTFFANSFLAILVLFSTEELWSQPLAVIWKWLVVWFFSVATVGTYLLIVGTTLLRNRRIRPVAIHIVIIVNSLIGVLYTTIMHVLLGFFGLTIKSDLIPAIFTNLLIVLWWSLTLSIFLDMATQSAVTRNELIEAAIQLRLVEMQQSDIAALLRLEVSQEVSAQLAIDKLNLDVQVNDLEPSSGTATPIDQAKWLAIAQLLEDIARDSIRPLSKQLWRQSELAYPAISWRAIFKNVVNEQRFMPIVIVIIDLLGALPAASHEFGFNHAAPMALVVSALIVVIGYSLNALMGRFPKWHMQIFTLGIFVFQIIIVPLRSHFRQEWIPGSASLTWQIGQVILGSLVIVMSSGVSAFRSLDAQSQTLFFDEINLETATAIARAQELAKFAQESSRILHGSIQSRLISCAMAIEVAAKSGHRQEFASALQAAYDVLTTSIESEDVLTASIESEVERKVALWKGLCQFSTSVEVAMAEPSQELSLLVGRVVEEAISNSIRHGKATHISITVNLPSADAIGIYISDNGVGFTDLKPGIGTALLEQATHGDWSINSTASGTNLVALLSIQIH